MNARSLGKAIIVINRAPHVCVSSVFSRFLSAKYFSRLHLLVSFSFRVPTPFFFQRAHFVYLVEIGSSLYRNCHFVISEVFLAGDIGHCRSHPQQAFFPGDSGCDSSTSGASTTGISGEELGGVGVGAADGYYPCCKSPVNRCEIARRPCNDCPAIIRDISTLSPPAVSCKYPVQQTRRHVHDCVTPAPRGRPRRWTLTSSARNLAWV